MNDIAAHVIMGIVYICIGVGPFWDRTVVTAYAIRCVFVFCGIGYALEVVDYFYPDFSTTTNIIHHASAFLSAWVLMFMFAHKHKFIVVEER